MSRTRIQRQTSKNIFVTLLYFVTIDGICRIVIQFRDGHRTSVHWGRRVMYTAAEQREHRQVDQQDFQILYDSSSQLQYSFPGLHIGNKANVMQGDDGPDLALGKSDNTGLAATHQNPDEGPKTMSYHSRIDMVRWDVVARHAHGQTLKRVVHGDSEREDVNGFSRRQKGVLRPVCPPA